MKKIFAIIAFLFFLSFVMLSLWKKNLTDEQVILMQKEGNIAYYYDEKETKLYPVSDVKISPIPVLRKTKNTLKLKTKTGVQVYARLDYNVFELVQESKVEFTTPKKIAILYISTGKYLVFWDNFYKEMEKYFLPKHQKTYFLFTDKDDLKVPSNVVKIHQDQLPYPWITFKRFHFFDAVKDKLKEYDYIYFVNGTMLPKTEINEEIFPTESQEIMATIRAVDFRRNYLPWFRYARNKNSKAYISPKEGKYYVMGGFNGGTSNGFLKAIETMKQWTDEDIKNNVIPRYHDESMLNRYVINQMQMGKHPLILTPEYSIPEDEMTYHRVKEFVPYIKFIILDKEVRGGYDYFRDRSDKADFSIKKEQPPVFNFKTPDRF